MAKHNIQPFDAFMNPVLQALKQLDGSGSNEEIYAKVAEIMELSDEQLELLHNPDKGSRTEVEYQIAWAKTYLKNYGLVENSSKGIWSLTSKALDIGDVNPKVVKRAYTQVLQSQNDIPFIDIVMVGRADKGLFITTGNFTKDALKEASRDGAPPLDLIDGDLLISKLQELSLGIKTQMIEQTVVDKEWFKAL